MHNWIMRELRRDFVHLDEKQKNELEFVFECKNPCPILSDVQQIVNALSDHSSKIIGQDLEPEALEIVDIALDYLAYGYPGRLINYRSKVDNEQKFLIVYLDRLLKARVPVDVN